MIPEANEAGVKLCIRTLAGGPDNWHKASEKQFRHSEELEN